MYRSYEDPFALEDQYAERKAEYEEALDDPDTDPGTLECMAEDLAELEDRIRFAWDDEEAYEDEEE